MVKTKGQPALSLWIVFDTNAVHNETERFLLRKEVRDLITENSSHTEVSIRWILPHVVRHERQYQMTLKAEELFGNVAKMERLLGRSLGVTQGLLSSLVAQTIDSDIAELRLHIETPNFAAVDWPKLALDSLYRRSPFEAGKTEKGFRDSLIVETFLQLVGTARASPKECRIIFVTSDKALTAAIADRIKTHSNVAIFTSVDEVRGLIHTLVSNVTEDFIAGLKPMAERRFHTDGDKKSLFSAKRVGESLRQRLDADCWPLPPGASHTRMGFINIVAPQFRQKQGRRIFWSTRLEVDVGAIPQFDFNISRVLPAEYSNFWTPTQLGWWNAKPVQFIYQTDQGLGKIQLDPGFLGADNLKFMFPAISSPATELITAGSPEPAAIAIGCASYDVTWSALVSEANKLTRARIDGIEFVEVHWPSTP